jgi:hypothetical protein
MSNEEHEIQAPQKRATRPLLRNRKGWKGFVWGYKDWLKATIDEGRWDMIRWGKPEESGAKEIVKEGNKTVYKF